jgi:hypothetical protein
MYLLGLYDHVSQLHGNTFAVAATLDVTLDVTLAVALTLAATIITIAAIISF